MAETALGSYACLDMMPIQTEGGDRPGLTRLEVEGIGYSTWCLYRCWSDFECIISLPQSYWGWSQRGESE